MGFFTKKRAPAPQPKESRIVTARPMQEAIAAGDRRQWVKEHLYRGFFGVHFFRKMTGFINGIPKWRHQRRLEKELLRAFRGREDLVKVHNDRIAFLNRNLSDPQIIPMGSQTSIAIAGIEARFKRLNEGKPREMDTNSAFSEMGLAKRIDPNEAAILRQFEERRQLLLGGIRSIEAQISQAALARPGSSDHARALKAIDGLEGKVNADSTKLLEEMGAMRPLYARLNMEYDLMHNRMNFTQRGIEQTREGSLARI